MFAKLLAKCWLFNNADSLNRDKTTKSRINFNLTKHEFDMKYEIEKTEIQIFGSPQEILNLSSHQSYPSEVNFTSKYHSTDENTYIPVIKVDMTHMSQMFLGGFHPLFVHERVHKPNGYKLELVLFTAKGSNFQG